MGAVTAKLTLLLVLALGLCACSTSLSPISEWEDEDPYVEESNGEGGIIPVPPFGDGGQLVDAGRPIDAAVRPTSDSSFPPLPEAGPTDSGIRRDAAVRDAAVLDGSVRDAGFLRDASILLDSAVDAAAACVTRSLGSCPANESLAKDCSSTLLRMCAYPVPGSPRELSVYTCAPAGLPAGIPIPPPYTRVQCPRNCFSDLPTPFEELNTANCQSRTLLPCELLVTDQLAVDLTLEQYARECGMMSYHLGMIFSPDGCARAIFSPDITNPAVKCVAQRLSKIRFGCTTTCGVARAP
jgi:hypothetical protein